MHRSRILPSLVAVVLALPAASAQIFVGGYVFDADAAPDVVVPLSGSQPAFASPGSGCLSVATNLPGLTLQQSCAAVFTDGDVDEWINGKARVQLDFTNNVVFNGPGPDLVVMEIGGAEAFALQVFMDSICAFSTAKNFTPVHTAQLSDPCGISPDNFINIVEIDLDAFGVLPGATVRRLIVDNLGQPNGATGADLALVMPLNSDSIASAGPGCLRVFQQGLDIGSGAYTGAVDTAIASDFPATSYASAPLAYVDASPEHNLLLRFDGLVGAGAGQIPAGSTISKATLAVCSGPGAADASSGTHALHQLLQSWNVATLTFASGFGGNGIDANGVEAGSTAAATVPPMGQSALQELDVTAEVQAWVDGAPNHGFALLTASSDGLGLQLSEAAIATLRPALTVQLQGQIVFAEAVAAFDPTVAGNEPLPCVLDPQEALHAPDYIALGETCCPSVPAYATLGVGGSITLEFTSISVAGNGTPEPDLWIYEVGGDVEDTFVELSADGVVFLAAGKVFGSTSAVDLDGLGFGPLDLFRYVRLTDDAAEGQTSGCTVGADIDAVAALAPNPWVNLGSALPGQLGPPKLAASGPLAAGASIQLAVSQAKPFGIGNLVLGTSVLDAPFKGGTMVPALSLLVPGLPLGPAGALTLPALWPVGLPAGLPIVVQVWIADAAGPKGFAATNAVMSVTQ